MAGDAGFEREFDFVDHHDRHRVLLQHGHLASDGQTVGDQLLALRRRDRLVEGIEGGMTSTVVPG